MRKVTFFIILIIVFLGVYSCGDKPILQDEPAWKKVCTQWGTSEEKVRDIMRTYSLKNTTSGTLTYKGKGIVDAVSYYFVEDSLCAVVVLMNSLLVDYQELRSSFSSYDYLGEVNSSELFVMYDKDNLVAITPFTKEDNNYLSVGYADLGDAEVEEAR